MINVHVFAPDAPGTCPVIFYSHGHRAAPSGAGSTNAKALADAGYIVVVPTHLDSTDQPSFIRDDCPFGSDATLHRIADISHLADNIDQVMTALPGYSADILSGNEGNDVLTGGRGNDTFSFTGAFGLDVIRDVHDDDIEDDRIALSRAHFQDFAAIKAALVQSGSNVVLVRDTHNMVVIETATVDAFSAHDFILV
jgi:hypothetical protein